MTQVQRLVVGAAATVAVVFAAAMLVLPALGSPLVGAVSNLTQVAVPLAACAACLDSARRQVEPRSRRVWLLLGVGALAWGGGQCVFAWYELVRRLPVPVPSPADLAFLVYPLLATVAVWLLPVPARSRALALRGVLDGLVIGTSLLLVVWALTLRALWAAGDGDLGSLLLTTTYVLGDMVLMTMVVLLLPGSGGPHRRVVVPVAAGTVAFTVADLGYVVVTTSTSYMSGEVFDVGWVVGFLGVAVGAVLDHPVPGTLVADPQDEPAGTLAEPPSWASILVPYVPVLAAGAVVVLRATSSEPWTATETVLVGCLVLLVLARQVVALADNRALLAEVSRRHEQARYDALHDTLTGLADRALFLDRVTRALGRADRSGGDVVVLFCDLDGFKQVNDVHGHAAGDRVLRAVAARLQAEVRTGDTVARLGGDEFAVLLEHPADTDAVVARIQEATGLPVPVDGGEIRPRVSVGAARARPGSGLSTDELVQLADHAMYRAKQEHARASVPRQGTPASDGSGRR